MKLKLWMFFLLLTFFTGKQYAQKYPVDTAFLSLQDFINIVKTHHPVAAQAKLIYDNGSANLLAARGGFDPSLYGQYDKKTFDNRAYWQQFDAGIKLPTWYGFEGKLSYEYNQGVRNPDGSFVYIDNERSNLSSGLAFAGFTFTPAAGLWMDERRSTLLKAKQFLIQSRYEQTLALNELYFEALIDYFNWTEKSLQYTAVDSLFQTAFSRYKNSINLAKLGDIPFNDTLDAFAQFTFFSALRLEFNAERIKAAFQLSNHLWLNGNPIKLDIKVKPAVELRNLFFVDSLLQSEQQYIAKHPKISAISAEMAAQRIDLSLSRNNILPKIDLTAGTYIGNFGSNPKIVGGYSGNHKLGVDFKMPLLVREQRGKVAINNIKLESLSLRQKQTALEIANKSNGLKEVMELNQQQLNLFTQATNAYKKLVENERFLFSIGETDFFKINLREQKLIESELKMISTQVKQLKLEVEYVKNLGLLIY